MLAMYSIHGQADPNGYRRERRVNVRGQASFVETGVIPDMLATWSKGIRGRETGCAGEYRRVRRAGEVIRGEQRALEQEKSLEVVLIMGDVVYLWLEGLMAGN